MKPDQRKISELFEKASLGAPQNAVGFVMWRVVHRYQRAVDQALQPLDLTHLQFVTLTLVAWLCRSEDVARQSEVARVGDIHPMQVSNVMKALELKAMITRSVSPGNPVAKDVAITAVGMAALKAALPTVVSVQGRLFGTEGLPGGPLLAMLVRIDEEK